MASNNLINTHPTIAVLTNMMATPFSEGIIFGASDYAKQHGYNTLCFSGSEFAKHSPTNMSRHRIFELIDPELIDGLIIPMGSLSRFVPIEEQIEFLKLYSQVPVITVNSDVPGYLDVGYSPHQGMFELVKHLVTHHGVEHFAFAGATGNHRASLTKKQAFIEALNANGLAFDEGFHITSHMYRNAPLEELKNLFHRNRQYWPQAIVACTDSQAKDIISVLGRMNIRVPEDVIVTGSMGQADSLFSEPPLTTIVEPTYDLGWNAAKYVVAAIEGKPYVENLVLPTSLNIQRSCGCNAPGNNEHIRTAFDSIYVGQSDDPTQIIIDELTSIIEANSSESSAFIKPDTPQHLAMLLANDLSSDLVTNKLLSYIHQQLELTFKNEIVFLWGQLALCIHRHLMDMLGNNTANWRAAKLASALFKIVLQSTEKAGHYRGFAAKKHIWVMREIGIQLNSEFNLDEISLLLAKDLDIKDCYINVFDERDKNKEFATNVIAIQNFNRMIVDDSQFSAFKLIPPQIVGNNDQFSFLVMPLSFQQDFLGYCVISMGERRGVLYESLLTHFSSAIKNKMHVRSLKAQEKRIRTLAYYDPLTHLPNRALFNERLMSLVHQATQDNSIFAMLFIDLDGFKIVNDSMGHDAGDILLQNVALLFDQCVEQDATLARFGGDEFVVLLPTIDNINGAIEVAQRITHTLSTPIEVLNKSFYITVSIGIAQFPHDGASAQTLIASADKAMYRSKQNGKNQYCVYSKNQ